MKKFVTKRKRSTEKIFRFSYFWKCFNGLEQSSIEIFVSGNFYLQNSLESFQRLIIDSFYLKMKDDKIVMVI